MQNLSEYDGHTAGSMESNIYLCGVDADTVLCGAG